MTQVELCNLLESTGLPVAYHQFKKSPDPPYIVYLFTDSDNFGADNRVYQRSNNYQVELYSDKKDPGNEFLLESLFDENEIYFEKTEVYIESEKLYQIAYEVQI